MKTCYLCNKEIKTAKRIIDNGLKYMCISEEDTVSCSLHKSEMAKIEEKEKKTKEQNDIIKNGYLVKCRKCENLFYTDFEIKIRPENPYSECPCCNSIVTLNDVWGSRAGEYERWKQFETKIEEKEKIIMIK